MPLDNRTLWGLGVAIMKHYFVDTFCIRPFQWFHLLDWWWQGVVQLWKNECQIMWPRGQNFNNYHIEIRNRNPYIVITFFNSAIFVPVLFSFFHFSAFSYAWDLLLTNQSLMEGYLHIRFWSYLEVILYFETEINLLLSWFFHSTIYSFYLSSAEIMLFNLSWT